jgi:PTH1 family peptidyl-tRNA hydrolase
MRVQGFGRKEREEMDIAIQEGIEIIRAVLTLGMEKAVSGNRAPR